MVESDSRRQMTHQEKGTFQGSLMLSTENRQVMTNSVKSRHYGRDESASLRSRAGEIKIKV